MDRREWRFEKLNLLSLVYKSDSVPTTNHSTPTLPSRFFGPHPLRHELKNMAITFPGSYGNADRSRCGSVCAYLDVHVCMDVCVLLRYVSLCLFRHWQPIALLINTRFNLLLVLILVLLHFHSLVSLEVWCYTHRFPPCLNKDTSPEERKYLTAITCMNLNQFP